MHIKSWVRGKGIRSDQAHSGQNLLSPHQAVSALARCSQCQLATSNQPVLGFPKAARQILWQLALSPGCWHPQFGRGEPAAFIWSPGHLPSFRLRMPWPLTLWPALASLYLGPSWASWSFPRALTPMSPGTVISLPRAYSIFCLSPLYSCLWCQNFQWPVATYTHGLACFYFEKLFSTNSLLPVIFLTEKEGWRTKNVYFTCLN